MRASRAVAACAVTALAMVFSVQQGEHGPLVVYKLQVPRQPVVAAPMAPIEPPAGAAKVLGTVIMPASVPAIDDAVPENQAPAGVVTLKEVNDALTWRRETAEKLPKAPFAPRF